MAPAHTGASHPFDSEAFTGRLDHARADGEIACLRLGIVHAVAAPEIRELGGEFLLARVCVFEMG